MDAHQNILWTMYFSGHVDCFAPLYLNVISGGYDDPFPRWSTVNILSAIISHLRKPSQNSDPPFFPDKNILNFLLCLCCCLFDKIDVSFCAFLFSWLSCILHRRIWWPFPQMIDNEHTERYNFSFEKTKPEFWSSDCSLEKQFFWLFCYLLFSANSVVTACSFEITMYS